MDLNSIITFLATNRLVTLAAFAVLAYSLYSFYRLYAKKAHFVRLRDEAVASKAELEKEYSAKVAKLNEQFKKRSRFIK